LTIGADYTYTFSWDILRNGLNAIDYIGSYNFTVTGANACRGLAASLCTGTNTTFPIPRDDLHLPAFIPFAGGFFNLFGGTITSLGDYTYPNAPSQDVRAISVVFKATQSTAILAWGGHISSPFDWGDGSTASTINGSPYHIANISLQDAQGNVVAGGAQDVQLSAAAVFRPSAITVTKTANKDGSFGFTSTLGGTAIPPAGETNPWALLRDESKSLSVPGEGSVSITETSLPLGVWRLKGITCSKMNEGEVFSYDADSDDQTSTAQLDVGEGETYDCTFDNEFFGAPVLEVIKKVIGPADSCTNAVRDSVDGFEIRSIHSGEQVRYCFWVTNTGNDPALDISLSDDLGGLAPDTDIALTGGANLDGDGDAPDLGVGDYVSGELVVAINVALNITVTNVATATGWGQFDGFEYSDTDDAKVKADKISSCTIVASVYTGDGTCPGAPQVNVLAGATVNWCAKATWDNNAALDLTSIQVDLLTTAESNTGADMAPGTMQTIPVGSTTASGDFTGILKLTGSEGPNPITCQSQATVDVFTPGINLTKTISLDDTCSADDSNMATIINGDEVWYCLKVENTGNAALQNVVLNDGQLDINNYAAGSLGIGEMKTFIFGAYQPSSGYTNTATTTAMAVETNTPVGPESSSATLTVLSADISVDKTVDPGSIVICDDANPPTDPSFCSEANENGLYDASYSIVVSNSGPNIATGVTVSDSLPTGFVYGSYSAPVPVSCDDTNLPAFTCDIGDMASGSSVTITVFGEIDPGAFSFPWVIIDNEACANTDPVGLDPRLSNNCDSDRTRLGTGATRTIGWWSTHPDGLNACLDESDDEINLGFLTIKGEGVDGDIDATISTDTTARGKFKSSLMTAEVMDDDDDLAVTAPVMAKGMMNASVAHWSDGTRRSHIGQARVKAAKQLTAAWCNETMFGSVFGNFLGGWNAIYLIMDGKAYRDGDVLMDCGGECPRSRLNDVIQSINLIGSAADLYNNSGDDQPISFPPGPANPKAPENDPTDPAD
jgi:uncharacterized repeat protein (TIGR01451 family)